MLLEEKEWVFLISISPAKHSLAHSGRKEKNKYMELTQNTETRNLEL